MKEHGHTDRPDDILGRPGNEGRTRGPRRMIEEERHRIDSHVDLRLDQRVAVGLRGFPEEHGFRCATDQDGRKSSPDPVR